MTTFIIRFIKEGKVRLFFMYGTKKLFFFVFVGFFGDIGVSQFLIHDMNY